MPQFNYDHPGLLVGQQASGNPVTINSYINALLAQESEVTVGGTDAGDYTVQIDGDEGSFQFTFTHGGGGVVNDIVTGLLAALDADPDLVNIVVGANASPELELDFLHPGQDYAISFPSNPSGNLTQTLIQAAGGTDIGLGLGVVPADPPGVSTGAQHVTAPNGAVDADFLGVTMRASIDVDVNTISNGAVDSRFVPSDTVSVMEEGEIRIETEDAVAFNGAVWMRNTNPGPSTPLGGFRSDSGGGEAILVTRMRFRGSTSSAGVVTAVINRP